MGFRNNYVGSVTKSLGEVLRWQWQRLRAGLPPPPTVEALVAADKRDFAPLISFARSGEG